MQCPQCGHTMTESRVREVTVDICLACRGVWFDPGELAGYLGAGGQDESPAGIFLTREDLARREGEIRADRIEKRAGDAIEATGVVLSHAWDLPAYLIEGIVDLLNP